MKAVCRIKKLHKSDLGAADSHNRRRVATPNANPGIKNATLIGDGKISDLVADRLGDAGITRPKKNAVHAVEIVLTASPEYFRPGRAWEHGAFDEKRTAEWGQASERFLKEKYGENLVALDVHLDEATPHIHAIVTPIIEKKRKLRGKDEYKTVNSLCAKDMFNRTQLVSLQDEYAKAVAPLGIKRGQKKSRAKHQKIKDYYGILENGPTLDPIPNKAPTPKPEIAKDPSKLYRWAKNQIAELRAKAQEAIEAAGQYEAAARQYALRFAKEQERNAQLLKTHILREDAQDTQRALERRYDQDTSQLRDDLKTAQEANEGLEFQLKAANLAREVLEAELEIKAPTNKPRGPSLGL